jgi:hypothetical protein
MVFEPLGQEMVMVKVELSCHEEVWGWRYSSMCS